MKNLLKEQYEELMSVINGCVSHVPHEDLLADSHILAIAIGEEGIIRGFLDWFADSPGKNKFTFVAQPKTAEMLKKFGKSEIQILEWQGAYTLQLLQRVSAECKAEIDAFVFWGGQKINLRNLNLLEIAGKLGKNINVYCIDGDNEVYKYSQVDVFLQAVKLYSEIDEFIASTLLQINGLGDC